MEELAENTLKIYIALYLDVLAPLRCLPRAGVLAQYRAPTALPVQFPAPSDPQLSVTSVPVTLTVRTKHQRNEIINN